VQATDLPGPLVNTVLASGTLPDSSTMTARASVSILLEGKITHLHLPLILKQVVLAPDLAGSFSLTPNTFAFTSQQPVQITVVITNQGQGPAGPFWVDFFINPSVAPTVANIPWDTVCSLNPCYGLTWYVAGGLGPDQHVTLTSTPDSFLANHTIWPGSFAPGTKDLYLYVDSWNPGEPSGAVIESDETNNRAELHGLTVIEPSN
jgi:hypothetical protein